MDRSTVTAVARAMGGKILAKCDKNTTIYEFPTDKKTLEFREKIPFESSWGGQGSFEGVSPLSVFFDKAKESEEQKVSTDISYVAFILGYKELYEVFKQSGMNPDEVYDYCISLAEQFVHSDYDDEDIPVNECIKKYVDNKIRNIYEHLYLFRMSHGLVFNSDLYCGAIVEVVEG